MKDVNDPTWQSEDETKWYRKIEDELAENSSSAEETTKKKED